MENGFKGTYVLCFEVARLKILFYQILMKGIEKYFSFWPRGDVDVMQTLVIFSTQFKMRKQVDE